MAWFGSKLARSEKSTCVISFHGTIRCRPVVSCDYRGDTMRSANAVFLAALVCSALCSGHFRGQKTRGGKPSQTATKWTKATKRTLPIDLGVQYTKLIESDFGLATSKSYRCTTKPTLPSGLSIECSGIPFGTKIDIGSVKIEPGRKLTRSSYSSSCFAG